MSRERGREGSRSRGKGTRGMGEEKREVERDGTEKRWGKREEKMMETKKTCWEKI